MVSGDLQLPASSWLSSMDHGALPATPDDHFYQENEGLNSSDAKATFNNESPSVSTSVGTVSKMSFPVTTDITSETVKCAYACVSICNPF